MIDNIFTLCSFLCDSSKPLKTVDVKNFVKKFEQSILSQINKVRKDMLVIQNVKDNLVLQTKVGLEIEMENYEHRLAEKARKIKHKGLFKTKCIP